jgi:endoglucanase
MNLISAVRCLSVASWLVGCACPCAERNGPQASVAVAAPAAEALGSTASGSVAAVKTCAAGLKPAADGLIDDIEDGNNRVAESAGRGGFWWDAKDDKGSSIEPSGQLKMFEGGANGSKFSVHVTGSTAAAADKAWGAVVGFRLAEQGLYDASKYAGVSFFAKVGEKSASQIRLKVADVNTHPDGLVCKEACYNDFGRDLTFSHDWQEYQVSFAELRQQDGWGDPRPPAITPSKLVQVAWHFMTPGSEFDLYLDDVRFVDCK